MQCANCVSVAGGVSRRRVESVFINGRSYSEWRSSRDAFTAACLVAQGARRAYSTGIETTRGERASSAVAAFQQGQQHGRPQTSSTGGATESKVQPPPPARIGEAVTAMLAEVQQHQEKRQRRIDHRDRKRMCFEFSKDGRCSRGEGCPFQPGE